MYGKEKTQKASAVLQNMVIKTNLAEAATLWILIKPKSKEMKNLSET